MGGRENARLFLDRGGFCAVKLAYFQRSGRGDVGEQHDPSTRCGSRRIKNRPTGNGNGHHIFIHLHYELERPDPCVCGGSNGCDPGGQLPKSVS